MKKKKKKSPAFLNAGLSRRVWARLFWSSSILTSEFVFFFSPHNRSRWKDVAKYRRQPEITDCAAWQIKTVNRLWSISAKRFQILDVWIMPHISAWCSGGEKKTQWYTTSHLQCLSNAHISLSERKKKIPPNWVSIGFKVCVQTDLVMWPSFSTTVQLHLHHMWRRLCLRSLWILFLAHLHGHWSKSLQLSLV